MNTRLPYGPAFVIFLATLSFAYGYWSTREDRPRDLIAADMPPLYNEDGSVAEIPASATSQRLLLFLLSTDCSFCAETTEAWRKLAARVDDNPALLTQLYVLSVSSVANTKAFLREYNLEGLPVFYLDETALLALRATAMPSTILREPPGKARYWDGVLSDHDVAAITRRLRSR